MPRPPSSPPAATMPEAAPVHVATRSWNFSKYSQFQQSDQSQKAKGHHPQERITFKVMAILKALNLLGLEAIDIPAHLQQGIGVLNFEVPAACDLSDGFHGFLGAGPNFLRRFLAGLPGPRFSVLFPRCSILDRGAGVNRINLH